MELLERMPGSTVIIKCDELKFQRMYICLQPLKEGFKAGCRRFVCLDGCFLKGSFKGQLLAAVGIDGDNGIYPVAWAVVEVENTDSWRWFVQLVKEDLGMNTRPDEWVVMTDQQKGLEIAIREELPEAEHRLCVKHLHANWSKRLSGKAFKDLMWEAARAGNVRYHEAIMERIKNMSTEAYNALKRLDKSKWTRCGFRPKTNCDMLVNNWAEAFNVVILKARSLPIVTLLNTIHQIVMTRVYTEYQAKEKLTGGICPRVNKLLGIREGLTQGYLTRPSGSSRYSVTASEHAFVVDTNKMECTCGVWQLGGIPCVHAVCVYRSIGKDPRMYVHEDFSVGRFIEVYSHFIEPIAGPQNWPPSNTPDILPPDIRVLPGRPKRCRNLDAAEKKEKARKVAEEKAKKAEALQKGQFKASRKGTVIHCGLCKESGHNQQTCPLKPPPAAKHKKKKQRVS